MRTKHGGIKDETASLWLAVRRSGTESVIKIDTESFLREEHLRRILNEAQDFVRETLATEPRRREGEAPQSPPPNEKTESEALETMQNEFDPN